MSDYYRGFVIVPSEKDLSRAAKQLSLARGAGMKISPGRATKLADGRLAVPLYVVAEKHACLPFPPEPNEANPLKELQRYCQYKIERWSEIDPRRCNDRVLDILGRSVFDKDDDRAVNVEEIAPAEKRPLARPEDAFADLVAMDRQKELFGKIFRAVQACGRETFESLHMAFVGPPGTGKSEVALRLSQVLEELGVTGGGEFVRTSGGELLGRFAGSTPGRVRSLVERARGGMLFIDEAYAMLGESDGQHGFGKEAIDTLVQCLEERRGDFVCVICGYEREISALYQANPGLEDRFAFQVPFEDFSVDDLCSIFCNFVGKKGFELDPSAHEKLKSRVKLASAKDNWANARSVRRLADACFLEAASSRDGRTILAEDIDAGFESAGFSPGGRSPVGFGR